MSGETSMCRHIVDVVSPRSQWSVTGCCLQSIYSGLYPKQLKVTDAALRQAGLGTAAQHCSPGQNKARWSEAPAGMYTHSSPKMDDIARCPIVKGLVVVAAAARCGRGGGARQDYTILSWHDWTDPGPSNLSHADCGVFRSSVRRSNCRSITFYSAATLALTAAGTATFGRSAGRITPSRGFTSDSAALPAADVPLPVPAKPRSRPRTTRGRRDYAGLKHGL